jgi:peptidyl-prolyl cis-trans isomerase A (cyclophilin A)
MRPTRFGSDRRLLRRRALTALACVSFMALTSVVQAQSATPAKVKLQTSLGDVVLELNATKAPKTVENFLQYVQDRHYDGTVFHRVIQNFMIQGGGFTADMTQKPTRAPIALEASNGLKNDRGTIAMARTQNPNSATAQFFINVVDNASLNAPNPDGYGYTVFGKVVSGMDVVDRIRAVPVGNQGMHQNVPTQSVTLIRATLEK